MWSWVKQRENEEELIFRGREYVEAIARYHARFNSYPPDLETLHKQKFLRKLYKDPMTTSGKWKVLRPDSLVQAGVAGQINQPGQGGLQTQRDGETGSLFPDSNKREEKKDNQKDDSDHLEQTGEEEPESEVIGPVAGVVSRSKKKAIKVYNGQENYNKWLFVYAAPQQQAPGQAPSPPGQKPKKGGQPKKDPNPPPKKNP